MKRRLFLLLIALLPGFAFAQQRIAHNPNAIALPADTVGKWSYHIDLGMGVTSGFGATNSYIAVAPMVEYKPNDKWAFQARMLSLSSTDMARFMSQSQSSRDLAPRRTDNSSLALAGMISAQYRVNDHLWLAASLWRVGGQALTPGGWSWYGAIPAGLPVDLNATGVTGEVHYDFGEGNSLGLYFSYINDRTGGLFPLLYDPYYSYGMGHSMFGNQCGFGSPFMY